MNIWNVLNEMESLQRSLGRFTGLGSLPKLSFLPGVSARSFPMMNLSEDKEEYVWDAS
jgi:hypothetical protein